MKLLYSILAAAIAVASVQAIVTPVVDGATELRTKQLKGRVSEQDNARYPPPTHQKQVKKIISTLSLDNQKEYLNHLTSFEERYVVLPGGVNASNWVFNTVQDIITQYPASKATVKTFTHSWDQKSVIARIPGSGDGPLTILSAHIDTQNVRSLYGPIPGADDGASGASNLLEAFRALLASKFKPGTPVEFQWTSAESLGGMGSDDIAKSYKAAGTKVKAVLNYKLTGYVRPGTQEVIALTPDYTDNNLNNFLALIIDNYSKLPHPTTTPAGKHYSDHYSWWIYGYPSTLPLEGHLKDINPYRQTDADTIDIPGFSFDHLFEFTKVAVGFAYELAVVDSAHL